MNAFDLGARTLYALLALASSAYLLKGLRIDLRALLKAIMAIQLLGDLLFAPVLQGLPVYRFIKSLSAEDRIYPLLVLMGCVLMMDLGATVVTRWRAARRAALAGNARLRGGAKKLDTAVRHSGPSAAGELPRATSTPMWTPVA